MTPFVWSQLLAAVGAVFGILSFQLRERRSVLLCLTALSCFNASHFLVLGRTTPAILLLLTVTQFITALVSRHRAFVGLYLAAAAVAIGLSYNGLPSWLAFGAFCCGTIGSFQHSDRVLRQCFCLGNLCWIAHNILVGSPVAILIELAFLTSNLVGYWRLYGRGSSPEPHPGPDRDRPPS
jgi:hypothetical protein